MVLPGWNVSEPIQLVVKLYEVVDALKGAPDDAKAFIVKVDGFRRSLQVLQRTLDDNNGSRYPTQDLEFLHATLHDCQDCVSRCEEFSRPFRGLTRDGNGTLINAGQRVRVVWQERKVAKLGAEIDGQVTNLNNSLLISNFQESQSRRGSTSASPVIKAHLPHRVDTGGSLPPYSLSPEPQTRGEEQPSPRAKTPSDILGLRGDDHEERMGLDPVSGRLKFLVGSHGEGARTAHSSDLGTCSRRLSTPLTDLPEGEEASLKPRESLQSGGIERTPESSVSSKFSESPPGASRGGYRTLSDPSPIPLADSCQSTAATGQASDLAFGLTSAPETVMENLHGVKLSYVSKNKRVVYLITRIESWQDSRSGRRHIVLLPSSNSNSRLFFLPRYGHNVPHSEHLEAYGTDKVFKVKFIDHVPLYSQNSSSSRRSSNASAMDSTPRTSFSSASSIRAISSVGSPSLPMDDDSHQEEARRHEYSFEAEEGELNFVAIGNPADNESLDYRAFQELVIGNDAKLQIQLPVQLISFKLYGESKLSKQSELQQLRLWQLGCHQYLIFFCNLTSKKHKEYRTEYFRLVASKSKTVVRLEVQLPGTALRTPKSRGMLPMNDHCTQAQGPEKGLTAMVDLEALRALEMLTIEFSTAEGKTAFLRDARFGIPNSPPIIPTLPYQARSSTV